ncbi:hypothetical protein ACQKOE_09955 [Novosphingobium sp. NPDC080210]|uniref:hypothetical protein n=1 Tax=Novosphingobium sp. NPDC080210 TaxID=3390596 RepID=UPI003D023FB1
MALYMDPLGDDEDAKRRRAAMLLGLDGGNGLPPDTGVLDPAFLSQFDQAFSAAPQTPDTAQAPVPAPSAAPGPAMGGNVPAAIAGIGMDNDPVETGINANNLKAPDYQIKRPGLIGRIKQQPGGAQALLAFGANMMMANDFFEGLGKGALAYQGTLDAEKEKLKPQFTKDFSHTYQIDPVTGRPTFTRTPVADYTDAQIEARGKAAFDKAVAVANIGKDGKVEVANIGAQSDANKLEWQDKWNKLQIESRERIAKLQADAAERRARLTSGNKQASASVLKQYDEHAGKVDAIDTTLIQAEPIMAALNDGSLKLGIVENLANKTKLATGMGVDDQAVLYGQLNTFVEGLRNTVLMDARGVQTDGDAERAKAQLLSGTGSAESVKKNLDIVLNNLRRRREYSQGRANAISSQYGIATSGGGGSTPAPARSGGWGKAKVVN